QRQPQRQQQQQQRQRQQQQQRQQQGRRRQQQSQQIFNDKMVLSKSTTTTARPIVAITQAGDSIIGICNTIAGGSTGTSGSSYPFYESPSDAIDGSTSTIYLSYGSSSSSCSSSSPAGIDTGFYITPAISNTTVALG
ncbi:unnamed protein product, partial [Rotaria sordida]